MSENALRDAFVECVENNAFQIELPTSRVKILMGKLDANFENMHTEEDCIKVCQSFYSRNIKVFCRYKNVILKYIEFAISRGEMTNAQLKLLDNVKYKDVPVPDGNNETYFPDFDTLRSAVEETFLSSDAADRNVYLPSVAAIYLAWCGVTIDQMCEIRKSDVSFLSVIIDGKAVQLNRAVMRAIEAYIDSVGYGTIYASVSQYKKSEYLFRTRQKAKLDRSDIKNMFTRFNALNQRKYGLTYKKIYMSGAFRRAYEYEQQHGTINFLKMPIEKLICILGININESAESRCVLQASFRAFKELAATAK
jgi:hypothetical protein